MKKMLAAFMAAVVCSGAFADTYDRYYTCNGYYKTDASDGVVGIYFQTVAEQGSSQYAYVVIGGVYPMGASDHQQGDVVIPETLEGLPVRKIADGAFVAQSAMKSITLPANLREIGDRAFAWCTSLTNVTFAGSGVKTIGVSCFSNCLSLVSVKFPASLEHISPNVFSLCDSLQEVTFEGNAPRLDPLERDAKGEKDTQESYFGEKRFSTGHVPARAVFRLKRGTYGWNGPYSSSLPERWPLCHGFMNAHLVEPWSPPSAGLSVRIAAQLSDTAGKPRLSQ